MLCRAPRTTLLYFFDLDPPRAHFPRRCCGKGSLRLRPDRRKRIRPGDYYFRVCATTSRPGKLASRGQITDSPILHSLRLPIDGATISRRGARFFHSLGSIHEILMLQSSGRHLRLNADFPEAIHVSESARCCEQANRAFRGHSILFGTAKHGPSVISGEISGHGVAGGQSIPRVDGNARRQFTEANGSSLLHPEDFQDIDFSFTIRSVFRGDDCEGKGDSAGNRCVRECRQFWSRDWLSNRKHGGRSLCSLRSCGTGQKIGYPRSKHAIDLIRARRTFTMALWFSKSRPGLTWSGDRDRATELVQKLYRCLAI